MAKKKNINPVRSKLPEATVPTTVETSNGVNRRQFLKRAAGASIAAAGFPYIVPSSALGKAGSVAPSNHITVGSIGFGLQGPSNTRGFLAEQDCRVVAVCNVDEQHLRAARDLVNEHYGNQDCATYHDFRELLARQDIDSVMLAVPDHWHGLMSVAAAQAGKDIYGEKPLSHNFREGQAICEAVRRYGRVWQTGSWQRSYEKYRFACELVRNGRIGKVHTVQVGLPGGYPEMEKGGDRIRPAPEELDYDFWLGPAPYAPYCPARVHVYWRYHLDTGGGRLMDWVGHHVDIAHWGLGFDRTGPVEIEGHGEYPPDGLWNAAKWYRLHAKYPNGLKMIIAGVEIDEAQRQIPGSKSDIRLGAKWIGEDGWVSVGPWDGINAHPRSVLKEKIGPNEVNLPRSPGHVRNFLDCVKSRGMTLTPCETAHRSATPGHLGQIAMLLGRKIRFNPETEQIIGDATATQMLGNAMRSPWHL